MKNIRVLFIDLYLILGVVTLVTGGAFLMTPDVFELFRAHPKYHRLVLSGLSLTLIGLFAAMERKGKISEYSYLATLLSRIRLSPLAWSWILFGLLSSIFFYSSYIRHHVFKSSFDLAIFAQAIWNTWHGNFLYSSIKGGICLLGDHVSPILALLAPLYGIWEDPTILLLFQAVVTASAILPIYLIGTQRLGENKWGLMFAVAYALYLPVRNAIRFDFHPELIAIPLCLWAYYFVLNGRLIVASVMLFFTLFSKETACLPLAVFGVYCWWFLKWRRFGIFWTLLALAVFFINVKIVVPHFSGQDYAYLGSNYLAWNEKGITPFFAYLFQSSSFTYLKKIFLPVGFLSFLSPSSLLLTGPALLQNLAARNTLARSIFFHYTVFLTPYVFISAINGFKNFLTWARKQHRWPLRSLERIAAYWLLSWSFLLTGVSEYHVIREYQRQDVPHYEYVRRYIAQIPSTVSVRTHEFFAPHLANRKELHIYENNHPREGGSEKAQQSDYVVLDRRLMTEPLEMHFDRLREMGYVLTHERDGFYVFTK